MPPLCPYTPCTSVHPSISSMYICMFPLYNMLPICHEDFGGSVHTIYLWVFLGATVHLSGISVSVGTSTCLSVHNSHNSSSQSLWATSLLDWMPMDVCCASCCCSFLCSVFIMSQVSTTTSTIITTPLANVVCSGMSSLLSTVTMAPSLMGLPTTLGQYDVVLPPLLTPRHSGDNL